MQETGFWNSIKRSILQLSRRKLYIVTMIVVPVASALFFLDLLSPGLPLKAPTAVVDLDRSPMSRSAIRSLNAMEVVDVKHKSESYADAMDKIKRGEIFGFFMIPENFEKDAISGRTPTISYYCNMTYYIPGTLSFKGFKTIAVYTSGNVIAAKLVNIGINKNQVGTILQPVVIQEHLIGNPWSNYSIYLGNSFIPGMIALMIFLVTAYSIGEEIKRNTARQWLETANNSIFIAVIGKLIPQTVIFSCVGIMCQSLLYGFNHFPLNCNPWHMIFAMILLVIASQSFALTVCCIIPNLRLSLSVVSLLGILSFSITGFSFPVESMYGAVGIFSHAIPLRYYFLIYADQALNGIPIYYSRWYYISLLIFPLIAMAFLWNLKRACQRSVYVP